MNSVPLLGRLLASLGLITLTGCGMAPRSRIVDGLIPQTGGADLYKVTLLANGKTESAEVEGDGTQVLTGNIGSNSNCKLYRDGKFEAVFTNDVLHKAGLQWPIADSVSNVIAVFQVKCDSIHGSPIESNSITVTWKPPFLHGGLCSNIGLGFCNCTPPGCNW